MTHSKSAEEGRAPASTSPVKKPRKLTKTGDKGIYKREYRHVVVYYVNGKQRREYVSGGIKEARRVKAARVADRDRGELQEESRIPFRRFAGEWVERYRGNGRRGFTEGTRDEYRRDLKRYAYPFFDERLGRTVSSITPRDVDRWIAWLCDEREQGRLLADASVRRIVSPLRACLATARREGVIRHNPADGAILPRREKVEPVAKVGEAEDEGAVKVFTRGSPPTPPCALPTLATGRCSGCSRGPGFGGVRSRRCGGVTSGSTAPGRSCGFDGP